tara:strand:+ start:300 stop:1238 length:939 start_codon:yes stop_codon:yes gene_type:complete
MTAPKRVAFIGLGAMGWGISGNLASAAVLGEIESPVVVWNRTTARSEQHADEFGTRCARALSDVVDADVIITCLPTSLEVAAIAEKLAPTLKSGSLWIDCTSGDPKTTKEVARTLKGVGVTMIDCPVSGGPNGAASGELTAMVGGDDHHDARPIISLFAKKKIVDCGPVGAGHAVKAMNNCLNAAHLIVAGEALLALAKLGVQPDVALDAINASSGRSLQTEVRIPTEVLTRNFDYGFKLGLMLKDVRIAVDGMSARHESGDDTSTFMLPVVKYVMEKAVNDQGYDADYTRVLRTLELEAGIELHGMSNTES